jgi:hypothetical protein
MTPEPDDTSSSSDADWTPIGPIDPLLSPPPSFPPPLADPPPLLLNTHEMPWESFEGLVTAMARAEGAFDVRRYGRAGQAQDGIDVVAFFADRPPAVYQAKRYQVLTVADFSAAVHRYVLGRRPFDAKRLVVAVAIEARDTRIIAALDEARQAHKPLTIELWDRQAISDRLRNDTLTVATYFGPATAAAFCISVLSPAASASSVTADAIMRGPLAHLDLVDAMESAKASVESNPEAAAELLGTIAERLEESGFMPHSVPVRELQATALRNATQRAAETSVRLDLAWRQLAAGDAFSAGIQARELASWSDAPEHVRRSVEALGAAAAIKHEHGLSLDEFAAAVDGLVDGDPHRADAALALAEEAVAFRHLDIVEPRSTMLLNVADTLSKSVPDRLTAARIRLCVAECGDDWEELVATARDSYPPPITALILARSARHLALASRASPSIARWRDAIERACLEGTYDDASDWLYSLRAVRVQDGQLEGDINELHRHALALRAAGNGSVLPEPFNLRERALSYVTQAKWPDALEASKRYLWRATVGADWAGEIEAHELIGDVFARTGRVTEAVRHWVFSGEKKKLEEYAKALPDEPTPLSTSLLTIRPWERAAAFGFVAARADLLPDDDARIWSAACLHEVLETLPRGFLAPDPWLEAFKAFGQLADLSDENAANQFLTFAGGLIPRAENTYRHSDEPHIAALARIARTYPALAESALNQLLDALLIDHVMAGHVLSAAGDVLAKNPALSVERLSAAAFAGNPYAALGVVVADGDVSAARSVAKERLEQAIAERIHQPGSFTFGTWLPQTAILVRTLDDESRMRFADGMLEFALDADESPHNRADALLAISNIAKSLPAAARARILAQVISFADGGNEPVPHFVLAGSTDPLQRFRVDLGDMSLIPAGLIAAAMLATTDADSETILKLAVALLPNAQDHLAYAIAESVANLPRDKVDLSPALLAAHDSDHIRSLAAVLWTEAPNVDPDVGLRLARDGSRRVRTVLARHLGSDSASAAVRSILASDVRRSIRQAVQT